MTLNLRPSGNAMTFQLRYSVTPRYLTGRSKRRSMLPMSPGVRFLVAHDTGNPGSTARGNVAYYERSRDEKSASAHIFVDDKEILECVPALTGPPEKAWHVLYGAPVDNRLFGHDANDAAIGVEYCFGGAIDADEAYRKYVWLLAYACDRFELDPRTQICGHFILDPARRSDPVTGLAQSRRTYEGLLRDVVEEFVACGGVLRHAGSPAAGGRVVTTVRLNVRRGAPSTRAPIHQVVPAGTPLDYTSVRKDGEPVNGNATWLGDTHGNWFWSGGVALV